MTPTAVMPSATPRLAATAHPTASAAVSPSQPAPTLAPPVPSQEDIVTVARADLAGRLNVAISTIELVSLEPAELPLPGLGCPSTPQPSAGPVVPALVAGQVLRLRAGGVDYEYRAHARLLVFCGSIP